MCGIAGVMYRAQERIPEQSQLRAIGKAIAHRGPDGEGIRTEPGIGLVHRRLAIIDLEGGKQPLGNEDDSVQIVFNGEIYNYQSLRLWLQSRGHRFRTNSDTEVLVHLYEEEGKQLVHRLRGMFAFAIWDRTQRKLLLARDRIGIKPLYYHRNPAKFQFSSEPKGILCDPQFRREVDPVALEDYLAYGMVTGNRSIFRGIESLPPGHVLEVSADNWNQAPSRYWQLQFQAEEKSTDEYLEQVRAKIDETVAAHLVADVPVGAFLSGGVDSSAIVASASIQSNQPLKTFSIGFQESDYSECTYARLVAKRYATTHHEKIITPDAIQLLDELTQYFDEPFADCSAIPTYLVAKHAAAHVKVALSGDGGDEAFGGYPRYNHDLREAAWRAMFPGWFRHTLLNWLARWWPRLDWMPRPFRIKNTLTNLSLNPPEAYANTLTYCRQPLRRSLLNPDVASQLNGHQPNRPIIEGFRQAPGSDPLAGMIAADLSVVMPDDYLVKVDRASMAVGLEVRPPFLDHELLEFAVRIPSRLKIHRGDGKWILKQAVRDRVPEACWNRPKQGFVLPINEWLKGPLGSRFQDAVLDSKGPIASLIHRETVSQLFRSHRAGFARNGHVLWSLLVLSHWANHYLTQPSEVMETSVLVPIEESNSIVSHCT